MRRLVVMLALVACARSNDRDARHNTAPTAETHSFFPIVSGPHAVDCNTCHGSFDSFKQFTCFDCHAHDQDVTDQLHVSLPSAGMSFPDGGAGYAYESESCLRCHPGGDRVPYDHAGITLACATCHDTGAPFAALRADHVGLDGGTFFHPDRGGNDCRACHVTTTWFGASGAPEGRSDPATDVTVTAQVPTYSGTSIASLSTQLEKLPMPMFHRSAALPAGATSACSNCHGPAANFFGGRLHASLTALHLQQPSQCLDCHSTSAPAGFVGPQDAKRAPASGAMKHDAVAWNAAGPTATPLIAQVDCAACHTTSTWTTSSKLHSSLPAQPGSCVDCHANSRDSAPPGAGVAFDHAPVTCAPGETNCPQPLADCAGCHSNGQWTSWSGGKLHVPNGTPSSCLPCHAGERPTSTAGWTAGYQASPFDYGTNAAGITHGAGQDCVVCHAGPGTGVWGGTPKQNWAAGHFTHGPGTRSATTCIACHISQRPDQVMGAAAASALLGFDHALNGIGDCFGCHQATVVAGTYLAPLNPAQANASDWKGGIGYPGPTLINAPQSISVTETTLIKTGALVTGMSTVTATLYDAMLHTSHEVPAAMAPASSTDWPKCAKCHAVSPTDGSGTLANGVYHASLTAQGYPQPSTCNECHAQMQPAGIVQKSGSKLRPMAHDAFTGDCADCHASPGNTWADGLFHSKIGSTVPPDCTVCHYPLMADAAADVTSAADFTMRHRSGQITVQNCIACHLTSLSQNPTVAASAFSPGTYHPNLSAQPGGCVECHAICEPAAPTQSTVTYSMPAGGTATNGAQWMSHGSASVAGKDCAVCHASDAQTGGSAWSKSQSFHARVANPATCSECHGGAVPGTNNNLPAGLTDSSMVTSAASDATTGIPAGTHDQITHADVNVSSRDCGACHTQKGASTAPGVQGKEWAQAAFHASVPSLNMNGSTGRCSNCHMNVKPTAAFPLYDHTGLSASPGTQDCGACHVFPGTGTPAAPNWLGASAAPAIVTLAGWTSGSTITSHTVSFSHPSQSTYTSCAQCHPGTDYAHLIDYNHDGLTSNVSIDGTPIFPAPNLGTSKYSSSNPTFCVHCHNNGSPWIKTTGLSSTITADTVSGSTTVSTASTSALVTGMTVRGSGIPSTTTTNTNFSASIVSGSTTVTTASPISLSAGTPISGTGIPAGDTVAASVSNATTFTLTLAATATASGVTLTATRTSPLTVTIKTIPGVTSFTVSTAANATVSGTSLTVTHDSISRAAIGNHENSTSGMDCTSCHYVGSPTARLVPPTAGVFTTGRITGN